MLTDDRSIYNSLFVTSSDSHFTNALNYVNWLDSVPEVYRLVFFRHGLSGNVHRYKKQIGGTKD